MVKENRNSNIELLRIFSMILIIIFHCVYKSDFIFKTTLGINEIITDWLWNEVFKVAEYQSSNFLVIYILLLSIIIFIIGMTLDLFRQILEKNFLTKILDNNIISKKLKV